MHSFDDLAIDNCKFDNIIEASSQMLLNDVKILRISQNINQFIIWQKVESRERFPLHFHVILQAFLDFIMNLVVSFKLVKSLRMLLHNLNALWHLLSSLHESFEVFIYSIEFIGFIRHCFSDIRSLEDILQISPHLLESDPFIDHVTQCNNILLQFLCFCSQKFYEAWTKNQVDICKSLVKSGENIIQVLKSIRITFFFPFNLEVNFSPKIFNFINLLSKVGLLCSLSWNSCNFLLELINI